MMKNIGIAVFTLNAEKHLRNCLTPFINSPLKPKILVVDSDSTDNTQQIALNLGVGLKVIKRAEFNHGLTREMARKHLNTDIVVMLTPDAYAVNEEVLEKVIEPIVQGRAVLSYARQIPHDKATFLESFPRYFNYPEESQLRSLKDLPKLGVEAFFCSDSCCAYLNQALDSIGGFREVLLGEDTFAASDLLRKGYQIAYTAEAIVKHSHNYTLKQEFQRYFDIGLVRTQFSELLKCPQTDRDRGKKFVKFFIASILKKAPHLLPYAILQIFSKWLGYFLGKNCLHAPNPLKKLFSSQKFYWDSKNNRIKDC